MNKKNLIKDIKVLDKETFFDITLGNMHETSITDNLLTTIDHYGDFIKYDPNYKETGKRTAKTGTAADYVLIIRDTLGNIHRLAFQAKSGKSNTHQGNIYKKVNYKISKINKYQIDVFRSFLNINPSFDGYYMFYNGKFTGLKYNNNNNSKSLNNKSFWILPQKDVENIMKTRTNSSSYKYSNFSIDDIVNNKQHQSFTDFLNKY